MQHLGLYLTILAHVHPIRVWAIKALWALALAACVGSVVRLHLAERRAT